VTRPTLTTEQAAAYLGFQTAQGIRHLVYSGELAPDGRGYRGSYMFRQDTLDRWIKVRQERLNERRGDKTSRRESLAGAGKAHRGEDRAATKPQGNSNRDQGGRAPSSRQPTIRTAVANANAPKDPLERIRSIVASATGRPPTKGKHAAPVRVQPRTHRAGTR
jgi:hypothetical protein